MERSKCLITDASGISIEYLLLFKRPVLYLNSKDKIHNERFDDFKDNNQSITSQKIILDIISLKKTSQIWIL